jgi:hypothetical protein
MAITLSMAGIVEAVRAQALSKFTKIRIAFCDNYPINGILAAGNFTQFVQNACAPGEWIEAVDSLPRTGYARIRRS